jgi:hypothetical protein
VTASVGQTQKMGLGYSQRRASFPTASSAASFISIMSQKRMKQNANGKSKAKAGSSLRRIKKINHSQSESLRSGVLIIEEQANAQCALRVYHILRVNKAAMNRSLLKRSAAQQRSALDPDSLRQGCLRSVLARLPFAKEVLFCP